MKEGFTRKKIRDIANVYSGTTPRTENEVYWNGNILWITPYDLSKLKGVFFGNTERKITLQGLSSCSAHLLPANTIVISSRAPIGYIAISQKDFCTNQGCKSLVFGKEHDALFFYYNLKSYVTQLKQLGEGTTFAEISKSYLEEFEIVYPKSKSEQIRIAQILSKADDAIAQTEALIAKYQRIKTGLMQDLLTKGIDENGNVRSKDTHEFVVKNGIEVPKEWEVKELNDISFVTRLAGYEYSTLWKTEENGDIIALRGFNIGKNTIIDKDFERISIQLSLRLNRSKLSVNDIVFPCVGTIGNAVCIKEDNKYHINQNIAKITPKKNMDSDFLTYYLMSFQCKKEIDKFNATSSQPNVLVGSLRKFLIPYPINIKEQKTIVNIIEEIYLLLDKEQKYLSKLHSLKTGLMQDLLSGRVRVV